jgi:23S rRNA maturation-related 3'-5' exoribonuclease YhaM
MMRNDRFDKFIKYAASTMSHHNQEHGLLIHTAETLANVILAAVRTSPEKQNSTKPEFDLSLTLLAALLHDVAKVEDYYRLAPGAYSTNLNCQLLGHEQTLLKWIAIACATSGTYPAERELRLEHAVSAVSREHDQTGARRRKTKDSFVLHDADCASARNFDKGIESVLISQQFVQGESA